MTVNYQKVNTFLGRGITLDNGHITLTATLDVGPRIIALSKSGGQNIMYNDVEDCVNKDCSSVYGEGKRWHIYGGHRLWLSPEDMSTYYPDNEPVSYELIDNGIILTPNKWEVINVQPSLRVEFVGEYDLKITHKVINCGCAKQLCLWSLTVLKCGGKMEFALKTEDTGLLPNRNFVMWPYSSLGDSRLELKDDKICVNSSVKVSNPFKLGAYSEHLNASYTLDGTTLRKRVEGDNGGNYPDYCCNFETYCSDKIHEIETLSPIKKVAKNGEITHIEYWSIDKENFCKM